MIVFAVALLLRVGWGTFRLVRADDPSTLEFPDERQYWLAASSLRSGDGLRDEFGFRATRMPLYPALLSAFAGMRHGVAAAKVAHWFVGAVPAVLTAGLAASLFERRAGMIAGLLVACDPFLIFFSSLLLTETLFIVGLLALWWMVHPIRRAGEERISLSRWIAAGFAAAFCLYVRPSSLGLVVVLFGLIVIRWRFRWQVLFGAALAGVVIVATLVPWAVRNRHVTGEWCWLTHRAGVSLYDGVGPQATGASDLADIQQTPEVRGLNEVEWNRYFLGESIAAIKADPARIARLAWIKLRRTWNPLPNVESYSSGLVRFVSAAWTVPVFAFAVAGVILLPRVRKREGWGIALFLLLPALYFGALHCLFVGSVRYRLPAMPMIEILAAVTVVAILDRVRRTRNASKSIAGHG
jgi:4-amino-4-deoxy-L-arabinose transferase-like glycosyltransferase